jgi:hypothetical protein
MDFFLQRPVSLEDLRLFLIMRQLTFFGILDSTHRGMVWYHVYSYRKEGTHSKEILNKMSATVDVAIDGKVICSGRFPKGRKVEHVLSVPWEYPAVCPVACSHISTKSLPTVAA